MKYGLCTAARFHEYSNHIISPSEILNHGYREAFRWQLVQVQATQIFLQRTRGQCSFPKLEWGWTLGNTMFSPSWSAQDHLAQWHNSSASKRFSISMGSLYVIEERDQMEKYRAALDLRRASLSSFVTLHHTAFQIVPIALMHLVFKALADENRRRTTR